MPFKRFVLVRAPRHLGGLFRTRMWWDRHGIVAKLEQLGLRPLAAQNVEHMPCEFRKLVLPEGRPRRGQAFEGHRELWGTVAPVFSAVCERRVRLQQGSRGPQWLPCIILDG